jgi:hypothetical protein
MMTNGIPAYWKKLTIKKERNKRQFGVHYP